MPINVSYIQIDRGLSISLARQLYVQLHKQIVDGELIFKEKLPATRALAQNLKLARGIIVECYEMLKTDGLIAGFGKAGTQVIYSTNITTNKKKNIKAISLSPRGKNIAAARSYSYEENIPLALTPSVPDFSLFPYKQWLKLNKESSQQTPSWYQRDGGIKLLKQSLQNYLRQYRGIHIADHQQLLITTGTQASLSFLANMLTSKGDSVLIDKPGWAGAQAAMQQANLDIYYAPVDEKGTQLRGFGRNNSNTRHKMIVITPGVQFPAGYAMSIQRRDEFVRYSNKHSCWLIEDDYAAEYSYKQHPAPSILAHNNAAHIIHVGTMSKLMFPGIRLGWMVVPQSIANELNAGLNTLGIQPSYNLQYQLGRFIQLGYLSSHLALTRSTYNKRRELSSHYIHKHAADLLSVTPSISGMNQYLKINTQKIRIDNLEQHLRDQQLGCDVFCQEIKGKKNYYLLLGHANLQESTVNLEINTLIKVLKERHIKHK